NDFETYDAKTNENTQLTANGLSGQLTFDYTFVPRNKGDYTLEPIEFVYFDTESGTYQTIRTAPISLKVA
ncbi:BatD family protein, partial [Acinetobacter sp. 163]|nr:BatD family protein [Acinetobacter sp. 163]